MRKLLFITAACLLAARLPATEPNRADEIIRAVLSHRPSQDLDLKAKLALTRDRFVPVQVQVKSLPDETRTLYRGEGVELLVTQPVDREPRFYLRGKGELTGNDRLQKLLGSEFTFYDLGLPFLRWPDRKLVGEETFRGRDCHLIECAATNQPYARVKVWIDKEYGALLRAEARNADGDVVRKISVGSFKRMGEIMIPKKIDSSFVPPNQALPAAEKSSLEILTGNENAKLPAEMFDPAKF